jgi:hypothetical protein
LEQHALGHLSPGKVQELGTILRRERGRVQQRLERDMVLGEKICNAHETLQLLSRKCREIGADRTIPKCRPSMESDFAQFAQSLS